MKWVILIVLNQIYSTPWLLSAYKVLKYFIRVTTHTSELYRLCNSTDIDSRQDVDNVPQDIIYHIDKSIYYSNTLEDEKYQLEQNSCEIKEVFNSIIIKKQFKKNNTIATKVLLFSLKCIYESNQLLNQVEKDVHTKYNVHDEIHEEKLLQLWNKMKPNIKLESRLTKQWVDIGFQGNDPSTDFRGMGIQGLNDLLYIAEKYPNHALSILQHASHPIYWYPYAIVGINITKFAYQLLESKKLQLYLFKYGTNIKMLQEFYCYLFHQFNQFWIHHQPMLTVMDFETKFIEFQIEIQQDLLLEKVVPFSERK